MFAKISGKFNVIVSNPPYIKTADVETLEPTVKSFEPKLALDGHEDGLYFYREIASCAPKFLTGNGILWLEIGKGQASAVKKLLTKNFKNIKLIKDYNKITRIVYEEVK